MPTPSAGARRIMGLARGFVCAIFLADAAHCVEWRSYNLPTRRVQEVITAMAPGKDALWIGYASGRMDKYELKSDRWTHYTLPAEYDRAKINDMKIVDRYLYLATDTGLCVFDLFIENFPDRPEQANLKGYPLLDIESTDRYLFFALAHDNAFGVDTPGGLIRYDRGFHTWQLYTAEDGLGSNSLNDIEVKDGTVWLGTELGLMKFEPETDRFTRVSFEKEFRDEDIRKLLFVDNKLWCGARGRIWEFTPATGNIRRFKLGDEYDYAVTKFFALGNFLLIGTQERGLVGYDAEARGFFEIEAKDVSPTVWAAAFYQGAVWIASSMGRIRDSLVSFQVSPQKAGIVTVDEFLSAPGIVVVGEGEMSDTPFQELVVKKRSGRDALAVLDDAVTVLSEGNFEDIRSLFADDFPDLVRLMARFKDLLADPSKKVSVTKADKPGVTIKSTRTGREISAPEGQKLFKIVFQKNSRISAAVVKEELTIDPARMELRGDKIVRWE